MMTPLQPFETMPHIQAFSANGPLWSLVFFAALFVGLFGFPPFIRFLKSLKVSQFIREDGPEAHHSKKGTPTGGGMFIIGIWALLANLLAYILNYFMHDDPTYFATSPYFLTPLGVTLALMGLGMWDDLAKVLKKHNKGLGGYAKLGVQAAVGVALGAVMVQGLGDAQVNIFGNFIEIPAWLYLVYSAFAVMSLSNAVNLTDGLDGLAGSTTSITLLALILILLTSSTLAPEVVQPLLLLTLSLLPLLLVFTLIFNRHPARVFMGDSGSLALGGFIAAVGLMAHQDAWLLLLAGIFALEALSVVLQVGSYKLRKKRLFKMAPIHHHFELCGLHETVVVRNFALFQALLCGLAVLLQVL